MDIITKILGMGLFELSLIFILGVIVIAVIVLQFKSFFETKDKISQLSSFFPDDSLFELKETSITKADLQSKEKLEEFIQNSPERHVPEPIVVPTTDDGEILENPNQAKFVEYADVDLINVKDGAGSEAFNEVVKETNAYLCKNVGTSADFSIMQDICERKIEILEAQITSTLNVPLYYGLAGTFAGIIIGLAGIVINVDALFNAGEMSPLRNLLIGVVMAMIASFVGLILMIINSAVNYKRALSVCNNSKNGYYDFIRRELLPVLSSTMAASLNSLKGVLGEFVGKFGHNLDAYTNSAELLNDNIEKQHLLLVEINKMDQTQMANQIASTFNTLKDAANSLDVFHNYQTSLNDTIQEVNTAVKNIDTIVQSFKDFTNTLNVVVDNQKIAGEMQSQFQESIETHFPTGGEARNMWRKQYDALSEDASKVSQQLMSQLQESTEFIQNFVTNNKDAFASLTNLREVLESLVSYAKVQGECYNDFKSEIKNLKMTQVESQATSAKLNKDLLTAVKEMISAIKEMKK